jgi:hypothetical protein
VDASDAGVGAVLLQEGKDDIDLPNCYFFLKLGHLFCILLINMTVL